MASLLSATELQLIRGDRCLFSDISFALNRGELLLIEGRNGSGKTSLLKGLAGLLDFDAGSVSWDGQQTRKIRQEFRAALVWLSHRSGFKNDLSAKHNLRFESGLRCFAHDDIDAALRKVGLHEVAELPMRVLSAGQQRRVGLARMILAAAPLWMMDEPFTNLDHDGQVLVKQLIDGHLAAGGIAVMASHQDVALDAPVQRVSLT